MVKIVIRNAKYSDLKSMKQINEKNLSENYDIDFWKYTFYEKFACKHSFVAVVANEIIGYIFSDINNVVSFAVNEKYRNNGIGKQLLSHCLNTYSTDLQLHVKTTNTNAQKLYVMFDFTNVKTIENYYDGGDAYVMLHKFTGKKYAVKNKLQAK